MTGAFHTELPSEIGTVRGKKMKKLTQAQKTFCRLYAETADPLFAATAAKLKDPGKAASSLIFQDEIIEETEKVLKKRRRLLMLMCENAVMKIICAPNATALGLGNGEAGFTEEKELRSVSEFKRSDKGAEVKFFDKIKAYEKLCDAGAFESDGGDLGLLGALSQGARALAALEEEDERFDV